MSAHDQLKAAGITPTIDAERAYVLGYVAALRAAAEWKRMFDQQNAANAGIDPEATTWATVQLDDDAV